MTSSHLKIDTSVALAPHSRPAYPSSGGQTPNSAYPFGDQSFRDHSPSSAAASAIFYLSPAASTNASATSLLLPRAPSIYSATTIDTHPTEPEMSPTEATQPEYVLAMHDYIPEQRNATCLAFRAGQVIRVLNRDSSGWWDGELDGNRGWFPSNYVNGDLALLSDDDLPPSISRKRVRHSPSQSTVSSISIASLSSSRHGPFSRDDYCPPLMVTLLHALSLLQNAVRSNRVAHFQPSVACIISCVRSILTAVGCLSRDAQLLRQFPSLAQERKRVLSDLAAIVNQAKLASMDGLDEDERDMQVEKMVRHGGQVFVRVRRFLGVAVQCGIELPDKRVSTEYPPMLLESLSSQAPDGFVSQTPLAPRIVTEKEDETLRVGPWPAENVLSPRSRAKARDRRPMTPRTAAKARSMGDLRAARKVATSPGMQPTPMLSPKHPQIARVLVSAESRLNSHRHGPSVSSMSSSSSFTSAESGTSAASPPFPSGPSTYEELMEALRHTHNQYLSTIAAFIGHAHVHSRSSHAASTGHMYELVREIVEIVCKLLVVVEAVLHHPTVPIHKAANLKLAKDGLYNVTSGLAESVRLLTGNLPPDMTEEQEKNALIRSATDALKAGSDCVAAVKMCLSRSTGEHPFVIERPGALREYSAPAQHISEDVHSRLQRAVSLDRMQYSQEDSPVDEADGTILASDTAEGATTLVGTDGKFGPIRTPVSSSPFAGNDPCSPVSMAPSDDRTTWEGNHDQGKHLEEKILHGNLPSVPAADVPQRSPVDPDAWMQSHDFAPEDVAYNSENQLVGATIQALVEKMTPHASIVDAAFASVFFLTFRLFASVTELVQTIIDRYNLVPPPGLSEERVYLWQQRKGIPVRLRVSNLIKSWLEMYWRPASDNAVLQLLLDFNRDALALMFPGPSQRIHDMILMRMRDSEHGVPATPRLDRVWDPAMALNAPVAHSPSEVPRPIMTKTLFSQLRHRNFSAISITDFDSLELARQLTIMECSLFCAIQADEILESGQDGAQSPTHIRAVTGLSTVITGWVAESILNETDIKKRTALVKFFIKLADRCMTVLNNFATSRSILAALDSSTISRLQQTWMGVPQKQKLQLDGVRKLADHARNYHEYRSRLRSTAPPAVPFLGLYLTDVTFCREGNPSHRTSPLAADKKLINFNKYHKMARIVQDMQRFQVQYTLKEIPEVQVFLNDAFEKSKHHGDLQDLYRRSLLVEPKQPVDAVPPPPSGDARQLFPWTNRSQASQQPVQVS
ncbi:ras guanine nucleotide exchange factor domain-containing protein [Gloeopeniophorella convolvens]|nr:ras guanine nucleotide exchange factor domain-containing protein [Gloeopeniophorella convolvens]